MAVACDVRPAVLEQQHQWISGNHVVQPVLPAFQAEAVADLKGQLWLPIEARLAIRLSGDERLTTAKYYYLAMAGYFGDSQTQGTLPPGTALNAEIATTGLAVISTFRLSRARTTTDLAVILSSELPLKQIVATCMAAE
jgi:hypothetical protein